MRNTTKGELALMKSQKMKMYSEGVLSDLLKKIEEEIINKIQKQEEDYILNVGEEQFILHLVETSKIDFPILLTDSVYVKSYEKEIPISDMPRNIVIRSRKSSEMRYIFEYFIPVHGDIQILGMRPSSWSANIGFPVGVYNVENAISIEVTDYYEDPEKIKSEYIKCLNQVMSSYQNLRIDVNSFNDRLPYFAKNEFKKRKDKILKNRNTLANLGVPINVLSSTSKTFSIPAPKLKEKITVKPQVSTKGFQPEPTLDDQNYLKILKIIQDVGKNFERMPSVYKGKKEEDLRDHILLNLDPQFENGSATGETFNKKGKTDIQIRYDSSVVFIAECKFWSGIKGLFNTIDQLLSYLTWRDTKTSIIIFIRNKEFTPILKSIDSNLSNHANYIRKVSEIDVNWWSFIFSLPEDSNKEIKIALQLFHLPN